MREASAVNDLSANRKRVAVIGGGISGLAAAHRLGELSANVDVVLLEAAGRLGGVLQTVRRDGYLIERSADNFIVNVPWATELCRRIGFADQLIPTATKQRGAMVLCRGRLERVPAGFMLMAPERLWPLVTTPILSARGKLRLLGEAFVPRRRSDDDESLAAFARRRLGDEAFERIVQPLVGGIYAADPERLSLQATMPRFIDMERRHGSLLRATRRAPRNEQQKSQESGARYNLFVAPREGMSSLVQAIANRLPDGCVRLGHAVERITPLGDGRWKLSVARPDGASELECEGVILTAPATRAATLLAPFAARAGELLSTVPYAGTSIVSLAYRRDQIARGPESFGFVVPACERRQILAASFASVKFPGRAPEGMVLVRVFIGGACQAELAELDDEPLREMATRELAAMCGTRGEPALVEIARWPASMPQYHVGHCQRIEALEGELNRWPTLSLAGNAYHGVGIPHCVHSGEGAAERVAASIDLPLVAAR